MHEAEDRDRENAEHDPDADRDEQRAHHASRKRSPFYLRRASLEQNGVSENDTGAEVRAGAFKLSRSSGSVADEVAAVDAADTRRMRSGSIEAVGEDLIDARHVDVNVVEEESGKVRRRIRREPPTDDHGLARECAQIRRERFKYSRRGAVAWIRIGRGGGDAVECAVRRRVSARVDGRAAGLRERARIAAVGWKIRPVGAAVRG